MADTTEYVFSVGLMNHDGLVLVGELHKNTHHQDLKHPLKHATGQL